MTRKLRPTDTPLDLEVQEAILSMTLLAEDGSTAMLGTLVRDALRNLAVANAFLKSSPLIKITAENLMRAEKKRGRPTLRVSGGGDLILRVSWGDGEDIPEKEEAIRTLPTLDELRQQAKGIGLDISDLGRQKHNILKRIRDHESTIVSR